MKAAMRFRKGHRRDQHFTEPPPRFTEATLSQGMEELGIGRPSTYAATLATLREPRICEDRQEAADAEDKGRIVTAFLESFFARLVCRIRLHRRSRDDLDRISMQRSIGARCSATSGRISRPAIESAKERRTTEVLDGLQRPSRPAIFRDKGDGTNPRACPKCGSGSFPLKLGKLGPFIGCSNYPECRFTPAVFHGRRR